MIYFGYLEYMQQYTHSEIFEIYKILFFLTNGFTVKLGKIWEVFTSLTQLSVTRLLEGARKNVSYNRKKYEKSYLTYSSDSDYVEYWKETKESHTVGDLIRNFTSVPAYSKRNICKILHMPGRRGRH